MSYESKYPGPGEDGGSQEDPGDWSGGQRAWQKYYARCLSEAVEAKAPELELKWLLRRLREITPRADR